MKIAIIDGGILCQDDLKNKILKKKNFTCERKNTITKSALIHGTTCARIIAEMNPKIEIYDLSIMYSDGFSNMRVLLKALEWCIQNQVKFIHMSIGIINYFDIEPLEKCVKKLLKQNTIIVAAYHNNNIRTYPACFPGVFGVRQDREGVLCENQFMFQQQAGICCENLIVAHRWGSQGETASNSYAAPVISGYITKFLEHKPEAKFQQVSKFLKCKSEKGQEYPSALQKVLRKKRSIEIPIIVGLGLFCDEMLQLRNCFTKSGYGVVILQEIKTTSDAIPMDYYFEENISFGDFIYTVNEIYKPDVIMLDSINGNVFDVDKESQIDVCIMREKKNTKYVRIKQSKLQKQ